MVALVRTFREGKQVIPRPRPATRATARPKENRGPRTFKPRRPSTRLARKRIPKPPGGASGELAARIRTGAVHLPAVLHRLSRPGRDRKSHAAQHACHSELHQSGLAARAQNAQLLVSILNGKGTLMPANNERVTPDQARDVVAYVRAFGPQTQTAGPVTDTQFERSFRQLQQQWDELERELKKLKARALKHRA